MPEITQQCKVDGQLFELMIVMELSSKVKIEFCEFNHAVCKQSDDPFDVFTL